MSQREVVVVFAEKEPEPVVMPGRGPLLIWMEDKYRLDKYN